MLKKKKMRFAATVLSMIMAFTFLGETAFAAERTPENKEAAYKVYNGYGEVIYEADSLEEAEAYLNAICGNAGTKSARSTGMLAAKTMIKGLGIAGAIITAGLVIYNVKGVAMGEKDVIDVIDCFFPASTLLEIANNKSYIYVYSSSGTVVNPYPPNSYQVAQWYKTNFYCVVGA